MVTMSARLPLEGLARMKDSPVQHEGGSPMGAAMVEEEIARDRRTLVPDCRRE